MKEEEVALERIEKELRQRARATEFRLDPEKRSALYRNLEKRQKNGLWFLAKVLSPLCLLALAGLFIWQTGEIPENLADGSPDGNGVAVTDPLLAWDGDRTIDRRLKEVSQRIRRAERTGSPFETSPLSEPTEIRNRIRALQSELI